MFSIHLFSLYSLICHFTDTSADKWCHLICIIIFFPSFVLLTFQLKECKSKWLHQYLLSDSLNNHVCW